MALFSLLASCWNGISYDDLRSPRYVRHTSGQACVDRERSQLKIVSFNLAFGRHVADAIGLFRSNIDLRDADIVLLQEMDAAGTRIIADSLEMGWYVYYPAIRSWRTARDFGNAVLSRFPVTDDGKLVLPHVSRYAGTIRTATRATIQLPGASVRVYSTHLGTLADVGSKARNDQLLAIVRDAKSVDHVIIGGDMNSASVPRVALSHGYAWPSDSGPKTTRFGRWDHILVRGFDAALGVGTVQNIGGTSDHLPIWVTLPMPTLRGERRVCPEIKR